MRADVLALVLAERPHRVAEKQKETGVGRAA